MSPLCHRVQNFLHCGGYDSLGVSESSALKLILLRRHGRARSSKRRGTGLAKVCGFKLTDNNQTVTVRFFGRPEDESSFLASYARVLLNCGLDVETEEDAEREGRQSLIVSLSA